MSLRPFAARVRRRLGHASIYARASERIELSPSLISDRPAAISLPGEFERASRFYEKREVEALRVAGGPRAEGATIAYLMRGALVAQGAVYMGTKAEFYRQDAPRYMMTGPVQSRDEGMLCTSLMSEVYFGDWLVENFSLGLIAEERRLSRYCFARPPWLHETGYRAIMGLTAEPVHCARFDRLWMVDDTGMNAYRQARFRELRRRLRTAGGTEPGPTRVYLARGSLGQARNVVNADALAAFLADRGYEIIHPERETPADLVRHLRDARVVVTVEGSAQCHALLAMPDDGILTILQPPLRFTAPGKDMADLAGLHYAYFVGDAVGDDFSIDLVRFASLLARVEARADESIR